MFCSFNFNSDRHYSNIILYTTTYKILYNNIVIASFDI